jgi:hypothetical protein
MDAEQITWTAPEYYDHDRSTKWYWASLIGAVILVAIALIQSNFLFAVFIAIAEIVVVTWARRKPHTLEFALSTKGVHLDHKGFYEYDRLSGFKVIDPGVDENFLELVLHTNRKTNPYLKIMFPREHEHSIVKFIDDFLPEMEYEDSALDQISHMLKF